MSRTWIRSLIGGIGALGLVAASGVASPARASGVDGGMFASRAALAKEGVPVLTLEKGQTVLDFSAPGLPHEKYAVDGPMTSSLMDIRPDSPGATLRMLGSDVFVALGPSDAGTVYGFFMHVDADQIEGGTAGPSFDADRSTVVYDGKY
jgi:hypothetical protein